MKFNLFLFILIAAISSTTLFAQRGMSHEDRMKNLDDKLNLSEEQYTRLDSILKVQGEEFQKLRDGADGDRDQMREKARKLMKETDEQIIEVLNEEQKKEYEKYKKERRQNRRGRESRN